jgi:YVTN family beta-propeller protein
MLRVDVRWAAIVLAGVLAAGANAATDEPRADITWPGLTPAGAVLLPNGWSLKPAGRQVPVGDLPVAIAEHPTEPILAILHAGYGEHEVMLVDAKNGRVISRVALPYSFAGLAWASGGKKLFVGGGFDDVIYGFDHASGFLSNKVTLVYPDREQLAKEPNPGFGGGTRKHQRCPAGLVISQDGKTLWVAHAFGHSVGRFDVDSNQFRGEIALGSGAYPYCVALDEAKGRLYVSLWGRGEVAVVDVKSQEPVSRWKTEEHPNELLLARNGKVLYVANANRNTVSVIDTELGKAVETIGTAIDPHAPPGCTPSSLALSADESVLFVANANTNDVAVVNVKDVGGSSPLGFIPVGWYPTCVRVARDGSRLIVANGKGATSKANRDGPRPGVRGGADNRTRQYIAGLFHGTLSLIPMPTPKDMGDYSKTVYECSPLRSSVGNATERTAAKNPIPTQGRGDSPITHCIYVVKENRTYDQVYGDMREGNGEPSLCLFPEKVTPNHHALAREFVLLDNFYVDGEVSADGHEWSMGAYASDFVERTWPLSYRGDRRVPYPSEGAFPIAAPAAGYIWDRAGQKGVTYRSYGEFIENGETPDDPGKARVKSLEGHFDPRYRSFDMDYSDQKRVDRFLEELAGFEKSGEMPRLIILRLPNDHTAGTAPGKPTVTAYVADNDLALGRLVEGLSKSRFWPHLAIFVVEDDAQNGSDHVDAHRTVALAISPYTKRHSVDSTMYSTSSMLRTMELILGLEPMSQFDAAARPMANSFTSEPDLTPYKPRIPDANLKETNLRTAWGAEASKRLNLEVEDRADDLVFNEIIWKAIKGAHSPMPPPVRAAFVIPRREKRDADD